MASDCVNRQDSVAFVFQSFVSSQKVFLMKRERERGGGGGGGSGGGGGGGGQAGYACFKSNVFVLALLCFLTSTLPFPFCLLSFFDHLLQVSDINFVILYCISIISL